MAYNNDDLVLLANMARSSLAAAADGQHFTPIDGAELQYRPAAGSNNSKSNSKDDDDIMLSRTSSTALKAVYPDTMPQAAVGATLKWCDSARHDFLVRNGLADEEAAKRQLSGFVMRSNAVEFLVPLEEWSEKVRCEASLHIACTVARVGRTSLAFRLSMASEDGTPLARVESVVVAVDPEDITKAVVVPCADHYKELCQPDVFGSIHVQPLSRNPRPTDSYIWRTMVRKSDCDGLHHINNAIYGTLLEDARAAATRAGAIPDAAPVDCHHGFPRGALIEFLGQPHEGDALNVAVWYSEESGSFYFEFFMDDGKVVSKASLFCGDKVVTNVANFVGSSMIRPAASSKL
mmetsp:Transcript_2769/g.6038  ORF Transcript_2769/g.6038 Transcript_2769/m.6038 type:complete len:348 (-) Transcript_2769:59-1102(-)|eukprot:CAMPEP_0206423004 /NCGR_PEP_ID=MMETSP0324_2-20121206/2433_1 /ASSEMBLY_ACC=CAM_ASM_000836 /TAXON_ID=2866 /ORGANISM="Crypthecodinium cohnii, Strain Seligo" /LENGTH=347 /DNA_ID=CAMNT_0053887503 /DNA_START=50 /DNA_END=1093 /DNA_ORIENTATION=-